MSEPKTYTEMWSQWDDLKAKSRNAFETAKEEIAKLEGWKFKGCDDGINWVASHQKERITIKARSSDALVDLVKKKHEEMQAAERKRAEDEAARKSKGAR